MGFTVLFAVDVEPFGGKGQFHFVFGDLGGLIVVEGVGVLVPGAGVDLDVRGFFLCFKGLHYNYIGEPEFIPT